MSWKSSLLVAGGLMTAAVALASLAAAAPKRIQPVIRPALAGEGIWHSAARAVRGRAPILVTTFRPDPSNPSAFAYTAWIDHTRTVLGLYPGSSQPPRAVPRGPAEIPYAERWRLLAAFNGGFKYGSHSGGGGGFAVNGHTYVALQRGLGTLVGYRNGRVDVVPWRGGPKAGQGISFARQNLRLLVDGSRAASGLWNQAVWGWTLGGGQAVWRTGVGIDREGNLVYVAVDDTASGLATALIAAGATRAIELDINPEWPTFDLYSHNGGLRPRQFVPNSQQPIGRYLTPDSRDFFAVYQRLPGRNGLVPFR